MRNKIIPAVIIVAAILAALLLNDSTGMMGQYMDVEEYLLLQADNKKTESLAVWEIPYVVMADEPVEVTVIDRKLEYLEHHEELDESTADGILETWRFNWLIKTDASEVPQSSIVLSARGMDENGYFSQSTGMVVFARHYPDGSYDILGETGILTVSDYLAQRNSSEESIYTWYQVHSEYK